MRKTDSRSSRKNAQTVAKIILQETINPSFSLFEIFVPLCGKLPLNPPHKKICMIL